MRTQIVFASIFACTVPAFAASGPFTTYDTAIKIDSSVNDGYVFPISDPNGDGFNLAISNSAAKTTSIPGSLSLGLDNSSVSSFTSKNSISVTSSVKPLALLSAPEGYYNYRDDQIRNASTSFSASFYLQAATRVKFNEFDSFNTYDYSPVKFSLTQSIYSGTGVSYAVVFNELDSLDANNPGRAGPNSFLALVDLAPGYYTLSSSIGWVAGDGIPFSLPDSIQSSMSLTAVGSPVAAVPEPGTYAMMFAGLGVLGFVRIKKSARRG